MFGDKELINIHKERSIQIGNIIIICFSVIVVRLGYLQIYKGKLYQKFSQQNRLRKEIVRAPRGMIFDRNDNILVDNTPRFDVMLTKQFLSDRENTVTSLAKILDMSEDSINSIIKKNSYQEKYIPIIIKKNISQREVAIIETENEKLPGISVNTFISRDYLDKEVGAHALGYISEISQTQLPKYKKRDDIDYKLGDFIGQFGIEEQVDKTIRGENGFEYVEVDALGRKKKYINEDDLFEGISNQSPQPGRNIKLTVDRDLQNIAYEALKGKSGSLTAIDINTGEVLAMISTPAFDPSQFSRGLTQKYWSSLVNNEENPLRDRNIQEHFSPGSTFKPFTAIAALEEGIINKNTKMQCHGVMRFNGRAYRSWKRGNEMQVDIVDSLKNSCNIFYYKIATELDIDSLAKYAKMFGFGKRTGVKLPREVSGLVPTREWKLKRNGTKWQDGETLSCAIGQSYVLTSTMQLANAYATIASKGKRYRPFIVKEIMDQNLNTIKVTEPVLLDEVKLKPSTWDLVQEGLYKVANSPGGTAFWKRGLGNQMAGKTGTSQVVTAKSSDDLYSKCSERPYKYRHHGVFVAYAPFDNPQIAVAALVEHGCGGSSAAAPIVEKVISKYMEKYQPELKEQNTLKEKTQIRQYIAKTRRAKDKLEAEENAQSEEDVIE